MRPTPSQLLKFAEVPAFLVTNPVNMQYLTAVPTIDYGELLVTKKGMFLLISILEREETQSALKPGTTIVDRKQFDALVHKQALCACEGNMVTVREWEDIKKRYVNTKIVHKEGIVEEFRRTKGSDELAHFRKSQRITQSLLKLVPSLLKSSITERQLAWKLEQMAREKGAEGLSFPIIVAFGPNTSRPHHHPMNRRLKKGDLVQIDMGVKVGGYCSDQSRVFFTKEPTEKQRHVVSVLEEAKKAATKAAIPGASTKKLDAIARTILKREGLNEAFTHGLGHGVGLEIHEGVSLSSARAEHFLLKNEIVTIEPGVYFPGKFGMRVEDEVVVGK